MHQTTKFKAILYQKRAINVAVVSLYTHLPSSYHSSACLTGIYQLSFVF